MDDDGAYSYTVVVDDIQIENVLHVAISFWDKPYQSDIHTMGAFRLSLGISGCHASTKKA